MSAKEDDHLLLTDDERLDMDKGVLHDPLRDNSNIVGTEFQTANGFDKYETTGACLTSRMGVPEPPKCSKDCCKKQSVNGDINERKENGLVIKMFHDYTGDQGQENESLLFGEMNNNDTDYHHLNGEQQNKTMLHKVIKVAQNENTNTQYNSEMKNENDLLGTAYTGPTAATIEHQINEKLRLLTPAERQQFEEKRQKMKQMLMRQMTPANNTRRVHVSTVQDQIRVKELSANIGDLRDRDILYAIRSGQVKMLGDLLDFHLCGPDFFVRSPNGEDSHPIIHWAALHDQLKILNFLIMRGANLDLRNYRGETALHWACLNGNSRSVCFLVNSSCDLYAADLQGYTAFHHAAQHGRTVICAFLARRGWDIDVKDQNGRTPLHWAAYKGEVNCAQWLLQHGADLSAEDFEKCLPIHWAAIQGSYPIASLLMKFGSCQYLDRKDTTGGTPAALAKEKQISFSDNKASSQYKEFERVAAYLEKCTNKRKDINQSWLNKHWSWYLWPILASLGIWQYFTRVFPDTSHYRFTTIIFLLSYLATWILWIRFQFIEVGALVIHRKPSAGKANMDKTLSETRIEIGRTNYNYNDSVSRVNPAVIGSQKYREMYFEIIDKGLHVPVCTSCEIVKPLRSKHDRVTDVCVARFDHNCPFLGRAVGSNNYFEFFSLLCVASVTMWLAIAFIVIYTIGYKPYNSFLSNFWELIFWEIFAWSFIPIPIYVLVMFVEHFVFISKNITTNETMNRSRYRYLCEGKNVFNQGFLKNWLEHFSIIEAVNVDLRQFYMREFAGECPGQMETNARLQKQYNKPASMLPREVLDRYAAQSSSTV